MSFNTVTLDSGEQRNIPVAGDTVHENVLYDVTADGAGVTFRLFGQATVRNVGIKGDNTPGRHTFRVGGESTDVTIDHVFAENWDTDHREPGGLIATKNSAGTITVRGAHFRGFGNNGLYASKSDADLYVSDCFFHNNRTSHFRAGGNYHGNNRDAVFKNCVAVVDDGIANAPLYPSGGDRTACFIARWGTITLRNCHAWMRESAPANDNWYVLRTDSDRGNPHIDVFDSQIKPRSRTQGSVAYHNVGENPTAQAPDYAPPTPKAAAGGPESHTGDSGGDGSGSGGSGDSSGSDTRVVVEAANGAQMLARAQTLFIDADGQFTTREAFFDTLVSEGTADE